MAISLFRAPVLPLALMSAVAAFVYSQRRRGPAVPPGGFPEPGVPPTGIGVPAPAGAEYVYCNNPNGCTLTEQDGSAVATASYGAQLVVTDRMEGWVRVRGSEGQGWARETSLTGIDPRVATTVPPPIVIAPPVTTPPGGPPLTPPPGSGIPARPGEPQDGAPCLGDLGCLVMPPHLISRTNVVRTTRDSIRASSATIPGGGQVDILEGGPVAIRITTDGDGIFHTPFVFYDPQNPDPNVILFYPIRYCTPGTNPPQCVEGWIRRDDLIR